MRLTELRDSLIEETATILDADFLVEVTSTRQIPHADDPRITFPNLDARRQSCKLIDTCVLYIDMRRSTDLSLRLRPQTVAKLYSSFVRAMTRCARQYGGHVRGIIGDRVMVLFDEEDCFSQSVKCAALMNSVSKYIINKNFTNDEVAFGIGIDAGKMLVTKTGIRKNGVDQNNYRNLVWLGKPANFASKLTDIANKDAQQITLNKLIVVYCRQDAYGRPDWNGQWEWPHEFVLNLRDTGYPDYKIAHSDPAYRSVSVKEHTETKKESTPAILMSARVWNGFRLAVPDDDIVTKSLIKEVRVQVEGLSGKIYGGNVIFTVFT